MKKYVLLLSAILPSGIRKILLYLMGAKIGNKVQLGWGSLILFKDEFVIGDHVKIASFCAINCKRGKIGSYSEITSGTLINVPRFSIGKDSKISYGTIIRSGHTTRQSEIVIGNLVHVFPFVMIDCSRKVVIGNGTGIGPKCNIFTHSSYKSILEGYSVSYGDVEIGERVELTYNVFVAPGVKIGDDAICAYGAYVNKDVESGALVAGMPAVPKRTKEQISKKLNNAETEETIMKIIEDYKDNISFISEREPISIIMVIGKHGFCLDTPAAYIMIDSTLGSIKSSQYAIFDVTKEICCNRGIDPKDFQGLRKYLSRYGIRFVSEIHS